MVEIGLEINFCYINGAIALGLIGNILKNLKKLIISQCGIMKTFLQV